MYAYLRNHDDYKQMLRNIWQSEIVGLTHEVRCSMIQFEPLSYDDFIEAFDIDVDMVTEFVLALKNEETKQIGPYNTKEYFNMMSQVILAADKFNIDSIETRQAIINFKPLHCFQGIQVFKRNGIFEVSCAMRSCNAVRNLLFDAFICYHAMQSISKEAFKIFNFEPIKLSMYFGSLHIFKDDFREVA